MSLILIFLLTAHADCSKEILVEKYTKHSNPNPYVKVERPLKKIGTEKIRINCDLYDQIKEGDELQTEVKAFRLFNSDNGVLEREYLKVIKKY